MIDFPAAPTTGTIYTPAGGRSYVFDGVAWLPAVPALRKMEMPFAVVARSVGDEKLPVGKLPLMGAFYKNIGGWNYAPNGCLEVPKAGQYLLRNRLYHNPAPTDPAGRLGIIINELGSGNFVHAPAGSVASCTLENTTVHTLAKGDVIRYEISVATLSAYTHFRHTEVQIYRLPDGWEAA